MKTTDLQKYGTDPIAAKLIKAGTFDVEKYKQVNAVNWQQEVKEMNIRTVEQAFNANSPSLATYRKYKGQPAAILTLSGMLIDLALSFNITNNMKKEQIRLTGQLIQQEYYFLTLADFKLCFNNAILGKYGEMYNRLDTQTIMRWLSEYTEERAQVCELMEAKKKGQLKAKPAEINPEGIRKIAELRQRLTVSGKIKDKDKPMTEEEKEAGRLEAERLMKGQGVCNDIRAKMERQAAELLKHLNLDK